MCVRRLVSTADSGEGNKKSGEERGFATARGWLETKDVRPMIDSETAILVAACQGRPGDQRPPTSHDYLDVSTMGALVGAQHSSTSTEIAFTLIDVH